MSDPTTRVLLVDPDVHSRALVARQLSSVGEILEAGDGAAALEILRRTSVKVVVTELYLPAADKQCLIEAIRSDRTLRHTRAMAYTHRCLGPDREWALRGGADAYLIKPTRAERLRYVVSRLATTRAPKTKSAPPSERPESPYRH
jgi:CheY-like chemotaxis protein